MAAEQGTLKTRRGVEKVVLKRVKTRVEGAEQMGQMEHLLNVHAANAARGAVAEFIGYLEVQPEEASTRLTQGLWLVRYARSASKGTWVTTVRDTGQSGEASMRLAQNSVCCHAALIPLPDEPLSIL